MGVDRDFDLTCEDIDSTVVHQLERHCREHPDRPFILHGNSQTTFGQLRSEALRTAGALAAMAVCKGDVVAVMLGNRPEATACWFATAYLGAIENPVNVALTGELLAHVLNDSGATVAIIDAANLPSLSKIASSLTSLRTVVVLDAAGLPPANLSGYTVATWEDFLTQGEPDFVPPTTVTYSETAQVLYTSGTTGPAKGVMISHRQQIYIGLLHAIVMRYSPEDVALNHLPIFHVANRFVTVGALLSGAKVVLKPRFSLSQFWDWVETYSISIFAAIGGIAELLYQHESGVRHSTLRAVYAVPAPRAWDDFENRFGVRIVSAYGQTETSLVIASVMGTTPPPGSMGLARREFEVSVVDEADRPVPDGTPGELVLRPRLPYTTTEGYLNRPDATAACMRNLWWHSGDRVKRDDDGYFYFLDRVHDAMRSRGENVSSFEVERAVLSHPAVAEVAAVGLPSALGDHDVLVAVVLVDGARLEARELFDHCLELLPYYAVPRYIEFRDRLPKTPTEKIRKVEIRASAADGVADHVWDAARHGLRVTREGLQVTAPADKRA
jgi:crotonobetaine/carnitine-CoA ligase